MSEEIGTLLELVTAGEWGNNQGTPGGVDTGVIRSANFTKDHQFNTKEIVVRSIEERKRQKKLLRNGDILIEKSGGSPDQPVGRVLFYDLKGEHTCSNFISILRPSQHVEAKFLYYSLCNLYEKGVVKNYQQQTTGIINLQLGEYLRESIYLPPLPEQKKIAEILSGIDKDICIHQQKAEDLDILLRELLRDHFQEKCEGSDLRLEKVTRATIQYGANASASKLRPGEPRYIRITDIKEDGTLNELNAVGIDLPLKDCGNYMLHEGDLLLARTGNTIGKSYLHSKPHEELVFAGYLLRVALDINAYRPEYLFLFTQSDIYKNWISETSRTGAQPNINAKEYGSMLIPSTSIEEQDDFIAIAMSLRSAKCILNNKIDKLKLLKQAISSDLLSGRKRVSV